MEKIEQAGRYGATVVDSGIMVDKNGYIKFVVDMEADSIYDKAMKEYEPLDAPAEVTGYMLLTKKDGSVNQSQVDALKKAFGWDGEKLEDLNDGEYEGLRVSIVVTESEYNGETQYNVDWINKPGGNRGLSGDALENAVAKWNSIRNVDESGSDEGVEY